MVGSLSSKSSLRNPKRVSFFQFWLNLLLKGLLMRYYRDTKIRVRELLSKAWGWMSGTRKGVSVVSSWNRMKKIKSWAISPVCWNLVVSLPFSENGLRFVHLWVFYHFAWFFRLFLWGLRRRLLTAKWYTKRLIYNHAAIMCCLEVVGGKNIF